VLADDIDLARGDLIADAANPPREARSLGATLVWLGDEPLRPGGRYLVQQSSRRTPARVEPDGVVRLNDIARAGCRWQAPLFVDAYEEVRATGCFILIDEANEPHRRRGAGAMSGTVHLVGAGPGAPDLLTVRAARLLGEADIVFHDALVPQAILALVKGEKVAVGKRCGRHSTAQRFINKRLADAAHRYRVVVRLKGGDPDAVRPRPRGDQLFDRDGIPGGDRSRRHGRARGQRGSEVSLTRRGIRAVGVRRTLAQVCATGDKDAGAAPFFGLETRCRCSSADEPR